MVLSSSYASYPCVSLAVSSYGSWPALSAKPPFPSPTTMPSGRISRYMTNIIRSRLRKILLPYGLIDLANVIFQRQWQKVRWLNTETSIQRFTVLMWIGLPTITFVLWLITNQSIGSIRSAVNGLNALVLISLIPMILSSLYSIALVIGTINSLYTSKQWEILRLTSQNQNAILMGYDAFFQLRLWPLVISEMGLRLSIFVIFLINHISETRDYSASTNVSFLHPYHLPHGSFSLSSLFSSSSNPSRGHACSLPYKWL